MNFTDTPLGRPGIRGSVRAAAGGWDVVAAGKDIWMEADEGHFAHVAHEGDFDLRARLASFAASHLYAKAGLMARESTADGSRHVFFLAFKDNAARNNNHGGFEGQFRPNTGGPSFGVYPPQPDPVPPRFPVEFPNAWLRLLRRNDDFEMLVSGNGRNWTAFGRATVPLPSRVLVGLAVTSHDPAGVATAAFRDIELTDYIGHRGH